MLKEPRPGRVKTRLGADIGMTRSAWWFRHQSARLIRDIESPKWQLILSVSPDIAGLTSRIWPGHIPRIAQGRGGLGTRMARIFRAFPTGPTIIIGADIPCVQRIHISNAFNALGDHDAVFGPATDGGFWLTGLKRGALAPKSLFNGVRWSTRHALSDTLATLPALTYSLIDTMQDVDTATDLARLQIKTG